MMLTTSSEVLLTTTHPQLGEIRFATSVDGDRLMGAVVIVETGDIREQVLWSPGSKPFAARWQETAKRRMFMAAAHGRDLTPLCLVPSAGRRA